MKTLIPVVTAACIAGLAAMPVRGQSVGASPALVMLKGNVGESTTQTLTISNSTGQPLAFEMVAKDIVVRKGKRVWVDAGELAGSIAVTAVFSKKTFTVEPGKPQTVDIHVTIPQRPASRAIVALFQGTTKLTAGQASVTASLGVILMFTLSDRVTMTATPLVVQPPTASKNLTVFQHCTNNGTEPIAAKGMLAILGTGGHLIGRAPLSAHRFLPGEQVEMRTEYPGDLSPGRYRALVTYDLGGKMVTSSADFNVK